MKRRYYRIHHYNHAQPMKRVKHHHVVWSQVLLLGLIAVLLVVGVLAVLKWVGLGKPSSAREAQAEPTVIPAVTPKPEETQEPTEFLTQEPSSKHEGGFEVQPISSALPKEFGFNYKIMANGSEQEAYTAEHMIEFGGEGSYTKAAGILTFAGDNLRSGFSYGSPAVTEQSLSVLWSQPVGSLSTDGFTGSGTGWTGQPVIIKWSDEVRAVLGVYDKFKQDEDFTEVIYPAMDGRIYFLDLKTGEQTRQPIDLGVITKGTAALDPRGYPLLYTGQGVTGTEDGVSGAWVRIIDLIENKVVYKFGGRDPFSPRVWQAYDSSPLVAAEADTLIMPGENGVIYFVHLNTEFDPAAGKVTVSPDPLVKYKYTVDEGYSATDEEGKSKYGFESSCACYGHYLYITDNGGHLQCIDMDTLELKFVLDVIDDSDSTPVLSVEQDGVYIYAANAVDKQPLGADNTGESCHRKINAATGEIVWQVSQPAYAGTTSSGGTLATPHVGNGEIEELVIYSMTLAKVSYVNSSGSTVTAAGGLIIAYDKATGQEVWRREQEYGFWSSPAVVYASDGKAYIVQADRDGKVCLLAAKDGSVLSSCDIGSRVESTPAVFEGFIVVGTRGVGGSEKPAAIYCIKIS